MYQNPFKSSSDVNWPAAITKVQSFARNLALDF